MIKILSFAIILGLLFISPAEAVFKYNPYSGKYENTSKDSVLKYNPYEDEYTYAEPEDQLKYNPYEDKYASKKNQN